jgi:Subtilase family
MWDAQPGLVDHGVPVQQQVEVERPRPVRVGRLASPAETPLDGEQDFEESPGGDLGLERCDSVQEPRLVADADGSRVDERRNRRHLDPRLPSERRHSAPDRLLAIAEVRAQPDIHARHAGRLRSGRVRRRLLIAFLAAACAFGSSTAAADAPAEWWLQSIGADQATPPGPGVPIVIIDGAVDASQPVMSGRPNTTYLDTQTLLGRDDFHATAVASLAAAPGSNNYLGVYPQANLLVWDAGHGPAQIDPNEAVLGISTAAQHCPAVINLSFGGRSPTPELQNAILTAAHNGCLVVAAAGNDGDRGNPVEYPAAYPHVFSVGATDQNDAPAAFTSSGVWIDVAAPGMDVTVAVPLSHSSSGFAIEDGTSFAAPLVSAAAAWVWTARPTLTASQVAQILRDTARQVSPDRFDLQTGYGVLNIAAALTAPTPPSDPSEPNDDIVQVRPGALFPAGEPPLTTASRPSNRIAGTLLQTDDPRDLYRIWVPPHRVVRVAVGAGGAATAHIWGPATLSVGESGSSRARDLKGRSITGGSKGAFAYADVELSPESDAASYVLTVTASKR